MPKQYRTVREALEESVAHVAAEAAEQLLESFRHARTSARGNDPFQVLGVEPDDPEELLRQVYRLKARSYHPDNRITGDEEKLKRVVAAYEMLTKLGAGVRRRAGVRPGVCEPAAEAA